MCNIESITKRIGKAMTAVLRHSTRWSSIADRKGAIPMVNLLDALHHNTNPLTHHAAGRIFAAMINGNDKQRFFVDVYMYDTWFPEEFSMPWDLYIGCHQGHSNLTVTPSEVNHRLTEVECYSMGWIFHVTDKKFENSIYSDGLRRRGRDAMHFMYENDGKSGYVIKGAGTRKPREYDTTIYCVLNVKQLLKDGYDLFLSANGVVLIYDDVSLEYFWIVEKYPYLGLCVFSPSVPHSLPREVASGKWRDSMTLRKKYEEYLSADEISKYLDAKGDLVEWHMPRDVGSKRRQSAWEFMGQAPPALYMECINSLFKKSQAETSTGSAPAEEGWCECNSSSINKLTTRWGSWCWTWTFHNEQPRDPSSEDHIREFLAFMAGRSAFTTNSWWPEGRKPALRDCLRPPWVLANEWESTKSLVEWRCYQTRLGTLSTGWTQCIFHDSCMEIGRMTGYVKNYSSIEEKEAFQNELRRNMLYGWLRDIPEPCGPMDESPEADNWFLIEQEEFVKDKGEVRMFELFCEAIEDLYTGMIDKFVRNSQHCGKNLWWGCHQVNIIGWSWSFYASTNWANCWEPLLGHPQQRQVLTKTLSLGYWAEVGFYWRSFCSWPICRVLLQWTEAVRDRKSSSWW